MDGALDSRDGIWGVGLIIRDSHGDIVGSIAMHAPSLLSVLATKLYALKVGLSFAFRHITSASSS